MSLSRSGSVVSGSGEAEPRRGNSVDCVNWTFYALASLLYGHDTV